MGGGVFLGVSTYNRPDYLRQAVAPAATGVYADVDYMAVLHDGPTAGPFLPTWRGTQHNPWLFAHRATTKRGGVAAVKNQLLAIALTTPAEWIILAEDDIVAQSREAVRGYVAAAERSGIEHLCFHAHGDANAGRDRGIDDTGSVTFWPNWVGAWTLTSRRAVEKAGMLDEDMFNALEHVEWSLRLAAAGFCPLPEGPGLARVPDATGSEQWLAEIPGSIDGSAILADGGVVAQRDRFAYSREVWRAKRPDTYHLLFGQ